MPDSNSKKSLKPASQKIKKVGYVKKILCILGIHSWKWKYIKPDSCQQTGICNRCAKKKKRIEHNWGDCEYKEPDSCFTERVCKRCGLPDEDEVHKWGPWEYESPTSCVLIRFCRRCDESDYDYDGGHQYNKKGVCKRCGEQQ